MLPPSGPPLSESECRNLGHEPGKQDGQSGTQCFNPLLVSGKHTQCLFDSFPIFKSVNSLTE